MRSNVIPVPPWVVVLDCCLLILTVFMLDSTLPIWAPAITASAALGLTLALVGCLPYLIPQPRKSRRMSEYLRHVDPSVLRFPEPTVWPESREPLGDLMGSVRLLGVMAPVIAYENGVGELVLLDGRRRVRAALAVGLSRVPVYIHEAPPPEGQALKMLALNVTSVAHGPVPVRRLARLLDALGVPLETVSEATGIPGGALELWAREAALGSSDAEVAL